VKEQRTHEREKSIELGKVAFLGAKENLGGGRDRPAIRQKERRRIFLLTKKKGKFRARNTLLPKKTSNGKQLDIFYKAAGMVIPMGNRSYEKRGFSARLQDC